MSEHNMTALQLGYALAAEGGNHEFPNYSRTPLDSNMNALRLGRAQANQRGNHAEREKSEDHNKKLAGGIRV